MAGESYAHLYCGYWVRHGSEQPYRKLPMLEGFTGLRKSLGSHMEPRASTLRFSAPVINLDDVKHDEVSVYVWICICIWGIDVICHSC